MPELALVALGVALTIVVAGAALRVSFAVLVGTIVLLPGTLPIPNGFTSFLTVHNAVTFAGVLAIVHGVRSGAIGRQHLRATAPQVALMVFVAVVLVNGVVLAGPSTAVPDLQHGFINVVAQLIVLTVSLAFIRAIAAPRFVIGVLATVLTLSAAIAIAEHFTGNAFGEFLFAHLAQGTDAAEPLVEAAGRPLRVRAGSQFALQFGWVTVMLMPALAATLLTVPRRALVWAAVPCAMALSALYWSYSRTALAALPIIAIVMWGGTRRNRRVGTGIVVATLVVAFIVAVDPSVVDRISPEADRGAIDSRIERFPLVAEAVADRPFTGLGLGGLRRLGVTATDTSYNQAYAETGVIGVAAMLGALAVSLLATARGLRGPMGDGRALAAVGFAGVLAGILGSAAFDFFAVRGSNELFWVLTATGVVGAELAGRGFPAWHRPTAKRAAIAGGGLAVGVIVLLASGTYAASTARFLTTPVRTEVSGGTGWITDRTLGRTACDLVESMAHSPGESASCREIRATRGVRELRFEASDRARLIALEQRVIERLTRYVPTIRTFEREPARVVRPTAGLTAPLWATWLAATLALLLPAPRIRETIERWSREGWAPKPQPRWT